MSTELDGFPNIPGEIIIEILLWCLPNEPYQRPDPRKAPILLTHVCSSWRIFASQVPELWRSILLSDVGKGELTDAQSAALKQKLLDQIVLWKHNSRGYPIGVSLEIYSPDDFQEGDEETAEEPVSAIRCWDTQALVKAIAENPQQLRKLSLKLRFGEMGNPIYALPSRSMSNLESLQIFIGSMKSYTSEDITSFSQAPNLRRVTIRGDRSRRYPTKVDLPWAQLTHLALLNARHPSILYFLATECHLLQILSLKLDDRYDQSSAPPAQRITMSNLQELSLTILVKKDLGFLLSLVHFPLLVKLRFCNNTTHYRSSLPDLFHRFTNHFINQLHQLRSLTLGYMKMTCDDVLEILSHTPLLVEVAVDSELRAYAKFLETLTYKPEDGLDLLVPKLTSFSLYVEIEHIRVFTFTNDSFFNMIISRSNLVIQDSDGEGSRQRPSRLKNVLLCIDKVDQDRQIVDFDDLASRVESFLRLGSGILLTLDVSSQKCRWLQEEIPF